MTGQLVRFNSPTECLDDTALSGGFPSNVWIEPGNIGILVSKYNSGLSGEYTHCEILVGDRIVSDVNWENVDPILGETNVN